MPSSGDSFQIRVMRAVNGKYLSCMRRSIQSIVLYEADRILGGRYQELRPFQRKFALLSTAVDLLGTLAFLENNERKEIMFRTNSSQEPLEPDMAWKRMKVITRDITSTLLPQAEELVAKNSGINHDQLCEILLRHQFDETKKERHAKVNCQDKEWSPKPYTPTFEYTHNNVFSVFRMYYRGCSLDPDIFAPIAPREVEIPESKPNVVAVTSVETNAESLCVEDLTNGKAKFVELSDEERRALLKEIKDHTELLKEFVGVIPDDELNERKRVLYASLPPVPFHSASRKKQRGKASVAGAVKSTLDEGKDPIALEEV